MGETTQVGLGASETAAPGLDDQKLQARVSRSRARWRRLGQSIIGTSPSDLAHLILVFIGFAGITWLIWNTWFSLLPFEIGLVLAYIMLPAVNFLDHLMPRSWAVAFILLAGLGVIVVFFALLIPAIANEIQATIPRLPTAEQLAGMRDQVLALGKNLPPPVQTFIRESLQDQYANAQKNALLYGQRLVNTALYGTLSIVNAVTFLLGFLVLPTWMIAVLGNQKSAVRAVRRALPSWLRGDFWAVVRIFDRAFGVILRGQIWRALVIAVLTWIGLAIIERLGVGPFPYKTVIAMWLGLFSLIPVIGLLVGTAAMVVFGLLLRGPQAAVAFVLLVIVVQQIESRMVSSRIESRVIDIHPAILVPALVAASQFGIFWVFIAAPLLVVVRDLFRYTYGRVSDPPAPAGILPTGESVLEAASASRAVPSRRRMTRPSAPARPSAAPARPATSTVAPTSTQES